MGTSYELTTDIEVFKKHHGPKINYSYDQIGDEVYIRPHMLLFELNVYFQEVTYHDFYDFRGLCLTEPGSDLPFDPFAASFFMLTRYEEITDKVRDKHDRFLPSHSIAYKYKFLDHPVVDEWAYILKDLITRKYPSFQFPERKFSFIPTIDVDQAFAYKYRQPFRHIGGILRAIAKFDWVELSRQLSVYMGTSKDPYDTFNYIEDLHARYEVVPNIFILLARYGRYDKNNIVSSEGFRELIGYLAQFSEIGLHPSYTSNFDFILLKEEMKKLAKLSGKWIKISRQHYLKLKFPETYNNLIKLGIHVDYSMGYARDVGFRAGTCTPFPFFDLQRNEELDIMVYPFQVMDRALQRYLELSPNQALERITQIVTNIKKVDGTFVSLWHNDAFSNFREYKGWKNVYKRMLEIVYS